jgi:hypothetical protein
MPIELSGPIVFKNGPKRIVFTAVLVPGEPDADGEVLTKEKIEKVAYEWAEKYRNVDIQHSLNNVGIPVVTYLAPNDMTVKINGEDTVLPEGTWIVGLKVNEETWAKIEKGELTGASIMGVPRSIAAEKGKSVSTIEAKRTLLKDLGDDWVGTHISLVDEPAVPKAKYFAFKSATKQEVDTNDQEGILAKVSKSLAGVLGLAPKEGRRFSEKTYSKLKEAIEALEDLLAEAETERTVTKSLLQGGIEEMTPDELKALMLSTVQEALKPLTDRVVKIEEAIAADAGKEEEKEEAQEETKEGPGTEAVEKSKQKDKKEAEDTNLTAIKSKLDELEKLLKPVSKGLSGQDDNPETAKKSAGNPDRDSFGRKVRG